MLCEFYVDIIIRAEMIGYNLKNKAEDLRAKGLSFSEIAKELGVCKSTARFWAGHVRLSKKDRKRLYTKTIKILSTGPSGSRARRQKELENIRISAEKEINGIENAEALKLIGAMLYWAEGNKTKQFALTNSDPLLIKFFIEWAKKIFGVSPKDFKAYLNIYSEQNDREIIRFWSTLTGIPIKNFGKSFIKPAGKNYKRNKLYYGTIKIRLIRGGDTLERVFVWIRVFLRKYVKEVDLIETKWNKLKAQS